MMGLAKYGYIPNELWDGIYQTGSSVICNPPVTDTDVDFVIFTRSLVKLSNYLEEQGYTTSTEDQEEYELSGEGFYCARKGVVNLIVVGDLIVYKRWVKATKLAIKFNLLKKEDRIELFQAILYPIEDAEIFDNEPQDFSFG